MTIHDASGLASPMPGTPYLLDNHPRSEGRVLLSRALEDYAAVEWEFGPQDIAKVFRSPHPRRASGYSPYTCLRIGCDNLVDLILEGRLRTFARPLGGGLPEPMSTELWEMDDPFGRFATSAFDPQRPFDGTAPPTHWIFVDGRDLALIIHVMCGGAPEQGARRPFDRQGASAPSREDAGGTTPDGADLLKLVAVEKLTGMSRSTIYAKVARSEFPEPLRLGSRFSRWRRKEVSEWLSNPR